MEEEVVPPRRKREHMEEGDVQTQAQEKRKMRRK